MQKFPSFFNLLNNRNQAILLSLLLLLITGSIVSASHAQVTTGASDKTLTDSNTTHQASGKSLSKTSPPKTPPSDLVDSDKPEPKLNKAAFEKEFQASLAASTPIDPLALLKNPPQYLNKKVSFTGTFNRFADIALDYKKAFRDSRDYVTFFILRPDVTDHTIPMSELKLFFPRKHSAEVMDLETGDKIQIVGSEFSTALDEPWVDVNHVKILQKTDKPEKKHEPEF